MTSVHQTQRDATIDSFERLIRVLRSETRRHWVDLELTTAQLKVLFGLEQRDGTSITQVAEELGVSLPTASHLVDRLVQAGYVARREDPADRRRTLATTTPSGADLVARLRQGGRDRLAVWLAQMSDADVEALHRGLTALERIATDEPASAERADGPADDAAMEHETPAIGR